MDSFPPFAKSKIPYADIRATGPLTCGLGWGTICLPGHLPYDTHPLVWRVLRSLTEDPNPSTANESGKKFDPGVGTTLYDLATDPQQMRPFRDVAIERRFLRGIGDVLAAHDAPAELYARYGVKRLADAA